MPRKTTLTDLLTQSSLKEFAGPVYYNRGVEYYENDAVELRGFDEQAINARVEGSDTYSVSLKVRRDELDWSCSCPLGDEGEFCKHVVATGLAWLARKPAKGAKHAKVTTYESPDLAAIRKFIERSDKQTLAELLLKRAEEDDQFAAKLITATVRGGGAKPAKLKDLIRKALEVDDYVDYRAARDVVDRAADVPVIIGDLLDSGDARTAAELAEYALELGFAAINQLDDSSGGMGGVLEELAGVHLEACEKRGLPANEIARSVFELQLKDDIGVIVLEPYRKALGKEGLAAYRKLAHDAWDKLPPPTETKQEVGGVRYTITRIMKSLAQIDGDTDAMVDIIKHDLRSAYSYLQIAELLAKARRYDEALQWTEDGRKKFPEGNNAALEDFLAAEYHRRGRHDDAIALHWARFEKRASLQSYQTLKASADQNRTWNTWREKALAHLQKHARKNAGRGMLFAASAGAALVEIHLWEHKPDAAREAARTHGCTQHLWLQLAKALEADKPEESIRIYQAQIDSVVTRGDKAAYFEAGQLIARLSKLMHAAKRQQEYTIYLVGVRLRHKAKRNFIKELDSLAVKKKV